MATYDPVSTASALAENYVYARQTQLDTASSKVQTQVSALTTLRSSLTSFASSLGSVASQDGVIANTASVNKPDEVGANVSSSALAGSYSFFVEQLASAQQSKFQLQELGFSAATGEGATANIYDMPASPQMALSVGAAGFVSIDLSKADTDGDGKLSVTEIARAVNASMDGKVTAAVLTDSQGVQQLLLNAAQTGAAGAFRVQGTQGVAVEGMVLQSSRDAKFRLGGASGAELSSSSNTYTGIQGLTVEFKAPSTQPVTVTVAKDEAQTKATMQGFVTAFNTLLKAVDKLTATGSAESGVAAGALSGDSSVRSLRSTLNNLLRTSMGGVSLTDFGISAQRDGTIALDGDRFTKKVASNPEALTRLLGQTNSLDYKRSGVLGSLQGYVESWTKVAGGHLQSRQDSLQKQQSQFTKQQGAIDRLYEQSYQRYLLQFSTLASMEDQMSSTSSMLASMFASTKTS